MLISGGWNRSYRKDIRVFTTDAKSAPDSKGFKSPVRLQYVFALFIETGAIYVVFFVCCLICRQWACVDVKMKIELTGMCRS